MSTSVTARRAAAGFGYGLAATVVMTGLMLGTVAAGVSPMPRPIPAALVAHTLGPLPKGIVVASGLVAHLAYGGAAAALAAAFLRRVTVWAGLAYGALLWLVMGLVWLPYLGWGLFGTAAAPPIAMATLVLHLVYGAVLGGLFTWRQRAAPPAETAAATSGEEGARPA